LGWANLDDARAQNTHVCAPQSPALAREDLRHIGGSSACRIFEQITQRDAPGGFRPYRGMGMSPGNVVVQNG
jgi:hypothetical protein